MYIYHAYGNGVCVAQITADTAANVPKVYSEYLKELLEKETGGKLPDVDGGIRGLVEIANTRVFWKQLIHLDNVKNYIDIEDLIKSTTTMAVKFLITSRTTICTPSVEQKFFSEDDCVDYLIKVSWREIIAPKCIESEEDRNKVTIAELKSLVHRVSRLPLRLNIVGRYLHLNHMISIPTFLEQLDSIRKNSPGDKFVKSEKPSNGINDVYKEVCLSFDSFKNQHPSTFWYLMSLEPDSIIHKYVMESFEQFKESWQHW